MGEKNSKKKQAKKCLKNYGQPQVSPATAEAIGSLVPKYLDPATVRFHVLDTL